MPSGFVFDRARPCRAAPSSTSPCRARGRDAVVDLAQRPRAASCARSVSLKPSRRAPVLGRPLGDARAASRRAAAAAPDRRDRRRAGSGTTPSPRRRVRAAGTKRCTAAQRSNRSMSAAARPAFGLLARDQRVQHGRERQLVVARRHQLGERIGRQLADTVAQRRRIVGGSLSSGYFLLARRTMKCFIRKIAASRAATSSSAWRCRLDAEQPRDERAQRPRHLDQQRRLLGRRQRARRRGTPSKRAGQRRRRPRPASARNSRVQRRQPLGLVEIAVPEAVDPEREVSRLVARRASGAVREGKCRGRQRPNS